MYERGYMRSMLARLLSMEDILRHPSWRRAAGAVHLSDARGGLQIRNRNWPRLDRLPI